MPELLEEYPWISYNIDLREMPFTFWFDLGQCVSKCDHIKQIPLLPEIGKELHLIYLAKGAAATTAIEGNTLGEEKALDIIKGKADISDSEQYQKREIENIIKACNEITKTLEKGEDVKIDIETLCKFNKTILSGDIPAAEGAIPGEIRQHSVVVGSVYQAPNAQDVRPLLEQFCDWIATLGNEANVAETPIGEQSIAILRAIAAHLYLIWIHPFGDGNGRLARLVEFAILLKSGIPSIAAHLLSNHYNATRTLYYQHLRRAKTEGPSHTFFTYAVKGFQDNLRTVIGTIINQIIYISWQQYVYEKFREMPPSDPTKRQRDVLIEMSHEFYNRRGPLSVPEIKKVAANVYVKHGKTMKSFTRDFNFLIKSEFIIQNESGYLPNLSPIVEMLPFSK